MKPVRSMTGFGSVEGEACGSRIRVEIKALNHRFLDLKVRLPRDLSSAEMQVRSTVQAAFSRGAIELKIERIAETGDDSRAPRANLALAAQYFECLSSIQKAFGLTDQLLTRDIASFPDVISFESAELRPEEAWKTLEPVIHSAIQQLDKMRVTEGGKTAAFFQTVLDELEGALKILRGKREACQAEYDHRLRERIHEVFAAHPIADTSVKEVLESRISQELLMLLDRTDIEEELNRFAGHVEHCRKVLQEGGALGRKLDFILQELNREINTLGNKAQDISISADVVQIKVRLEQLREQVLNLE